MNLTITGHHLEITPAIRGYVEDKMARVTRHFDQVIDVSVILAVEKLKHKAEVNLHLSGKDIFVEAIDADMYAAIGEGNDERRGIAKELEGLEGDDRFRGELLRFQAYSRGAGHLQPPDGLPPTGGASGPYGRSGPSSPHLAPKLGSPSRQFHSAAGNQ